MLARRAPRAQFSAMGASSTLSISPTPTSGTLNVTAVNPINWASIDVSAFDLYGNEYHHAVDGNNHR